MFSKRVRLIGLAVLTGLLFSIMMGPSVLAREFPQKNKNFDTSLMEDKFANATGSIGFAKVQTEQEGSLVAKLVVGQKLLPDTNYDVHVVVTASDPDFVAPILGGIGVPVTTDSEGSFNIENIDTLFSGVVGTEYRVDIIVVKNGFVHPGAPAPATGPHTGTPEVTNAFLETLAHASNWDVVLACTPAFFVTIVD